MNGENINIGSKPLRVLISPLHWGLGHATRIIPVIKLLQAQQVEVLIAAGGAPALLLKKEFPHVTILEAPFVEVQYSAGSNWFLLKMLLQAPRLLMATLTEKRWLKKAVAENRIDAVISDNRFGWCGTGVPAVFITHQLFINAPNGILRWLAQRINYFYINKFSECWVPDLEQNGGLAGKLSHPLRLPPIPVFYLGPLSRLQKKETAQQHILISLSGPEPQRSIWEKKLVAQLAEIKEKVVLVRGLPGQQEPLMINNNVELYAYADTTLMNRLMNEATVVIARSGYSTVMDLVNLGKKALLVPTPGQGEQEWLAKYLMEKKMFYSIGQADNNLADAIQQAKAFDAQVPAIDFEEMNATLINNWVQRLRERLPQ